MILPGHVLVSPFYPTLIYDEQISELKDNKYMKTQQLYWLMAYSSIIIINISTSLKWATLKPGNWDPESEIWNLESGKQLTETRIRN